MKHDSNENGPAYWPAHGAVSQGMKLAALVVSCSAGDAGAVAAGGIGVVDREPAALEGGHDGLRAVIDGQFAQDRGDVVLDGLGADTEGVADLGVGHAIAYLAQDLELAIGQWREGVMRRQIARGGRAELLEDPSGDIRLVEQLLVDD